MPVFGATSYQIQVVFVKQIKQDEKRQTRRAKIKNKRT